MRERLEAMLAAGQDTALLRFSLGNECLKAGEPDEAARQFRLAVTRDPGYSAAWKLLGRALKEAGQTGDALSAWREGLATARDRGDLQVARELEVFIRRLEREGNS